MKSAELDVLIQTVGWVLLHSLWQGLIIYLLLLMIRRILPSLSSSAKYILGTGSLALMLAFSVTTFLYLLQDIGFVNPARNEMLNFHSTIPMPSSWEINPPKTWLAASLWINDHLRNMVSFWMVGTLLFGCRLLLAGWYTSRLRRDVIPIVGFWENRLRDLAEGMGIRRTIFLAQSRSVDSPVLLGFLKPVILLPVGVLSGLSVEQVEAILMHELAHIKRCDYAVNFIQSMMEVVFFFNPFLWAISSQIRIEREQCCDDTVVRSISPIAYAQALCKLEETRWPVTSLALAAAGRKNHLLHRIKRIMEPLENKNESGGKMIPALLLIAVIMISGLFIRAYFPEQDHLPAVQPKQPVDAVPSDTTIKSLKKEKKATYSRHATTTFENGEPKEEITEDFEGDEELRPMIAIPPFEFEMPSIDFAPLVEVGPLTELEPLAELEQEIEALKFDFEFPDTLPGSHFYWKGDRSWEDFEKAFTEKFRERFSDFYKKNQPEFEKMMKDLEANIEKMQAQRGEWRLNEQAQRELMRANRELERLRPEQEQMMRRQEETMRKMESKLNQKNVYKWKMRDKERWKNPESEAHLRIFEKELTKQLVKDGYLGKEDKINSINWEDDGNITVNGKKIKESDRNKYHELHEMYFRERGHFRHEE